MEQNRDPADHRWLLGSSASPTVAEPPSSEPCNPALHYVSALDVQRAQEETLARLQAIQNNPPTQSPVQYTRAPTPVQPSPSVEVISSSLMAAIQAADNLTMSPNSVTRPASQLSIQIPDSASIYVSDSLLNAAHIADPTPIFPSTAPSPAGSVACSFQQHREPTPSVRSTPSPEDVDMSPLPVARTPPPQGPPSGTYYIGVIPSPEATRDVERPHTGEEGNPIVLSSGSTPRPAQSRFPSVSLEPLRTSPLRVLRVSQVS